MRRLGKITIALLLIAVFTAVLAGCGQQVSAEEWDKAMDLSAVTNATVTMESVVESKSGDNDANLNGIVTLKVAENGIMLKIEGEGNLGENEGKTVIESYFEIDGNTLKTYTNLTGKWSVVSTTIPGTEGAVTFIKGKINEIAGEAIAHLKGAFEDFEYSAGKYVLLDSKRENHFPDLGGGTIAAENKFKLSVTIKDDYLSEYFMEYEYSVNENKFLATSEMKITDLGGTKITFPKVD